MTQASGASPTLYDLPHELRGARVCLRPYAVGDGVAVQKAIEESRDHLRSWMRWTDSRSSVQACETYVRQALAKWITQEDVTVGMWDCATDRYLGGIWLYPIDWAVPSMAIIGFVLLPKVRAM
jgi:hypothetical protein